MCSFTQASSGRGRVSCSGDSRSRRRATPSILPAMYFASSFTQQAPRLLREELPRRSKPGLSGSDDDDLVTLARAVRTRHPLPTLPAEPMLKRLPPAGNRWTTRDPTRPKKFTEPVALSSTRPSDLPLPRTAAGLSFDLLALRARCETQPMAPGRGRQGARIAKYRSLRTLRVARSTAGAGKGGGRSGTRFGSSPHQG